jgi:hypothetical protein
MGRDPDPWAKDKTTGNSALPAELPSSLQPKPVEALRRNSSI